MGNRRLSPAELAIANHVRDGIRAALREISVVEAPLARFLKPLGHRKRGRTPHVAFYTTGMARQFGYQQFGSDGQ